MQQQSFYVYMLASIKGALYIGMTRDIAVRMEQHRLGSATGFSSDYRTTKLVCAKSLNLSNRLESEKCN